MSHYFADNSQLAENRREISFRFLGVEYKLTSDDGVFSKGDLDRGTEALLKVCSTQDIQGSVADLGCGIGVIGIVLSQMFPGISLTGVDVNSRAVALANLNYKRHNINGENIVSDGLEGTFDFVVTNPPIRIGKEKMYSLFDDAYESLNPNGSFLFVIRKSHGAKSAQAKCIDLFGNCELLKKDKGFYIYRSKKVVESL